MKAFRTEELESPTAQPRYDEAAPPATPALTSEGRLQRLQALAKTPPTTWPARYELLALAGEAINDFEWAAFWRARMKKCTDTKATTTGDYTLPPGYPRWRALQIAGVGETSDVQLFVMVAMSLERMVRAVYAPLVPSMRTDAVDESACPLEKKLARGLVRAAGGHAGELRVDAAEAEAANKVKDAWDGQASRKPSATYVSPTTRTQRTEPNVERHDEASSSSGWGEEWKRKPRSDAFVEALKAEPARNGGLATSDVEER